MRQAESMETKTWGYISGEDGAATRTEDTETRGYRSWSGERSMLSSAAVNGGCAGGIESRLNKYLCTTSTIQQCLPQNVPVLGGAKSE